MVLFSQSPHPQEPPTQTFHSIAALKRHLTSAHQLSFCDICLESRQVFVGEQQLYDKEGLERHMRRGDLEGPLAEAGFKGHPRCNFCK
jgi:E3 ubiquitin-protein ligase ZNF598